MKRSVEEVKAWRAKMGELAKSIRALPADEREALAVKCGTVTCEGRPLSPFNCCFLWSQAGRALSMIGGFRQWKKAGRMVRKGEHAAGYIYVPTGKGEESEAGEDERVRFLLVPVFDVSQTEAVA